MANILESKGEVIVNIIMHYPKSEDDLIELRNKVAVIHAEAVATYIEKLHCPTEQKIALIDAIISECNS